MLEVLAMMYDVRRLMAGQQLIAFLFLCFLFTGVRAQVFDAGDEPRTVRTQGIWDNWFVQADLDMTLQNPYGYSMSEVFPNGKSFGLDLSIGKWFSHQVGVRGKFNWENKLPLLENEHANWLAPFNQPGVNREKGGYIAIYADGLFNLHNFFGPYRADRTWNLSLYPRIGVNYNFGVSKGSLLAGVGMLNTYRLNDRWSLLADVAYIMIGSGFVGQNESGGTGTGSNSNGYLSIGLGAQYELGSKTQANANRKSVFTNDIWDNWFVQAGLDMDLMNPYRCNFSKVIPKGTLFGMNVALGKWFTPELGFRLHGQWDNGLIENKSIEWVPPVDDPRQNYKEGGLAVASLEAMLNLTNAMAGYEPDRKWHTTGYVRAGIISQFVTGSASPLMGAGLEETYRLNDKFSLFGNLGYQWSTSEGLGVSTTGMEVSTGSNGFFDMGLGIRYDLGRNMFYRNAEEKKKAYSQPVDGHNWPRFFINTGTSVAVAYGAKTALKAVIHEERPDHSDNKSFPSGHASMAFAAARSLDKEFRSESIWIPIAGYAAATAVGVERVASDRHHWYDVVAGAALGYGAAELTWWLSDKYLGLGKNFAVGCSGNTVDVKCNF